MKHSSIYANYEEKFIKTFILFAKEGSSTLFFDESCEEPVPKQTLSNMFYKGLVVNYKGTLYATIYLLEQEDDESEIGILYNEEVLILKSETPEEIPEEEPNGDEPIGEPQLIEITPDAPTMDGSKVITIPDQTGVIYKIGDNVLNPGEQEAIVEETTVVAVPDEGYKFTELATSQWVFTVE